jgi:hypothetical protein
MPFLRKTAIWCKRYMTYLYGQASQENAIRICPADLLVPNDQPIRLPCPSAHSLSPSLIYHFAVCLPPSCRGGRRSRGRRMTITVGCVGRGIDAQEETSPGPKSR